MELAKLRLRRVFGCMKREQIIEDIQQTRAEPESLFLHSLTSLLLERLENTSEVNFAPCFLSTVYFYNYPSINAISVTEEELFRFEITQAFQMVFTH